jgi:hypothetical protein
LYEPFSLWKQGDKRTDSFNVQDGYRVTWEPEAAHDETDFIIFMLSGSTTYCRENPDELTIASILAKRLNGVSSNYRYVVRNYGVTAFVSDNEVHLLVKLLRAGKRPDVVIFYDGLNDINIKAGVGQEHFFEAGFRQNSFRPARMRRKEVALQLAYRSKLVWHLTGYQAFRESLLPQLEQDQETLRRNAESMLRNYEENALLVSALGKEYGFRALHFWQPSIYNTGKTLTSEEMSRSTSPAAQLVHDIVAEAVDEHRFFERTGIIDLAHALDDVSETIFVDSGHITPIGNGAVVDAMLPWILDEIAASSDELRARPRWS